jgi:hypothetical protein
MATDTTRVSSYVRAEGFYDSAGTMYQYASAVNNLVSGLTASANYLAMNRVFSGLTASCVASQINNLFSGLASTVSAGMITGYTLRAATADAAATSLAAASASYAASAGTLSGVTATAGRINALQYSTASHKVVYGSSPVTGTATINVASLGLTTLSTFIYTKSVSCMDYVTITGIAATSNIVVTFASGGAAATGTIYYMAVND